MPKYWVIVANSNHCRIFQCHDFAKELTLLNEYSHEQSKLKNGELVSDRAGSYKSVASNGASFDEVSTPKENEKIDFAKELATSLDSGRSKQAFDQLIIIAPPHFSGLLSKQLNKNTTRLVTGSVMKDYTDFKDKDLSVYLHGAWREIIPL